VAGGRWIGLRAALSAAALGDGTWQRARLLAIALWIPLRFPWGSRRARPFRVRVRAFGRPVRIALSTRFELETLLWVFRDREYDLPGVEAADVVVDLGANTGLSALWYRARYPAARIHAVEPDPAAVRDLRANLAGIPGVEIHPFAVAGESGSVALHHCEDTWASSLLPVDYADATVSVAAVSLDDLLGGVGAERISILKLNVEGAEWDVLRHATSLDRVDNIVGEFHDDLVPVSWSRFAELLEGRFEVAVRGRAPHRVFSARRAAP
jgi:FkbM family methyltransferase